MLDVVVSMMNRAMVILVTLIILMSGIRTAGAAARTVEELTHSARVIAMGSIESISCERHPSGNLVTSAKLRLTECWKGSLYVKEKSIIFARAGGILGTVSQKATRQRPLTVGNHYLLFLEKSPNGSWVTTSVWQGQFDIRNQNKQMGITDTLASNNGFIQTNEHGMTLPLSTLKDMVHESLQRTKATDAQ